MGTLGTSEGTPRTTDGWRLRVEAGPRPHRDAAVVCPAPEGLPDGAYRLLAAGESWPAQIASGEFLAVLPALEAGEARAFELQAAGSAEPAVRAARRSGAVEVTLGDEPLTTLRLEGAPKPFLHPLLAPGGVSVVRGWPVAPLEGDSHDHPHHRGLWIGHGDCNGMDAWEEHAERLGRIEVGELACLSGPVCATVRCDLRWLAPGGRPAALEQRLHRFWALDGQVRLLDVESTYSGPRGAWVRFGDTKEGALCGVRVATGMEEGRGGRITTAEGAVGEAEAWGSAAGWCDYSGEPAAAPGATVGVAILDHPSNPLHPTRWHVRGYGLMTANPFALSHYQPRSGQQGDWLLPAGRSATFRFRVLVHQGDAGQAEVARRYADWAFPPRCTWARA